MFQLEKLERIIRGDESALNVYAYNTSDSISSVLQAGYFPASIFDDAEVNIIHVYASDTTASVKFDKPSVTALALDTLTTGWAAYTDTQYVDAGTAFTLPADTDTVLPNNAGSKIETQMPPDVTTFYDGTAITGRDGDSLDFMIYFKAVPSVQNQWLEMWVDIGGSVGELYRQTFSFPRGLGVERGILYSLSSGYTLNTWEANKGTVYIRSNAALDIYGININLDRSHKAR